MLVHRNGERKPAVVGSHHLLEEAFYCGNITLCREQELYSVTFFIQRTIEILPLFTDFDVGLI